MARQNRGVSSKALRLFWKPMGAVNPAHTSILQQWLNQNAKGIDIATFIHSSEYAKKHTQALNFLYGLRE
ncbi:MAG: hypothetical protein JO308_13970 [Verrucomicrobia bacterium]|nr:hypothetical protein [Verrucomicrobiota bacterium]